MTLRPILQRAALLLVGILAGLALVEVGLQAAALVVWLRTAQPEDAAALPRSPHDRVVLCVGDSFTFGSGASSSALSYPRQLEQLLRAAAKRDGSRSTWHVVNRGWPGRNSSELLRRIPSYLSRDRPDYVVAMIGGNNRWSPAEADPPHPGRRESGEDPGAAAAGWSWRTLRLLRIAAARFRGSATAWEPAETAADHRLPGDRTPSGEPEGPADLLSELRAVEKLLASRELMDSREIVLRLDLLRTRVRSVDSPHASGLLLDLLRRIRRDQDVIEEGRRAIERFGSRRELLLPMVTALARRGLFEEALDRANELVELSRTEPERAEAFRARATARLLQRDLTGSLQDSVKAFAAHGAPRRLERDLRGLAVRNPSLLRRYREVLGPAALALLAPETEQRVEEAVRRVLSEAGARTDWSQEDRLAQDLLEVAALVTRSGAHPVLLTYPRAKQQPGLWNAARKAAREAQATLVDLAPVFEEALARGRWEDYFISDGHCNDAGYHMMAEQVARRLIALDSAQGRGAPPAPTERAAPRRAPRGRRAAPGPRPPPRRRPRGSR